MTDPSRPAHLNQPGGRFRAAIHPNVAGRERPPRAMARAPFAPPSEGPPRCVHGAVLAAAFDQVINIANIHSGTAGPTRTLALEYKRPTPLGVPLVFEAWVDAVDGRKITSRALVRHAGEVTVEASGLFILVDCGRVMRLSE